MPKSIDSTVTMVAFWPTAVGDAVESVAFQFGPPLSWPLLGRRSSEEEPRLQVLAGYGGFAMAQKFPAPDSGRPHSVHLWLVAPARRTRTSATTETQS